jgi:hypothetical protein
VQGLQLAVVDDVRFVDECAYLRNLSGMEAIHFHVVNPKAVSEPQYNNETLKKQCDCFRRRQP